MRAWPALFFVALFLNSIGRLHAPDWDKRVTSQTGERKSKLWESPPNDVTKTVESELNQADDSSTSSQRITVIPSSSAFELEELVTPTEAPATPSYDSEPSLPVTNTVSSIETHGQASNYILSSVILIPPSNPSQVQSSQEGKDLKADEGSSSSERAVPTEEPEVFSSVLDSTPPTPISSEPSPTPPSAYTTKDKEDSITADLNQAEEEIKPKEEEMPSFDEFKRRVLQKEEEKSKQQNAEGASAAPQKPKKVKERKQSNYASVDCGAKILEHNSEASNAESILVENKDLYMLNPCSAQVWFVVELCDVAQVKNIQIANFELFSSTPESFRIHVSKRYPTREWTMLGTFQAREEREIQSFPLEEPIYAKYLKVEMLSHFGSEHYCPLSLLRVYGLSMMEELEDHETEGNDDNDNADSDSEVPVLSPQPGVKIDDEHKRPNLLERAADTVISLVKKFTGNPEGSDKENNTDVHKDANDSVSPVESINVETAGQNGSQDVGKGKLVTLVGHEDLTENPQESSSYVSGEKLDDVKKKNGSQHESVAVNVSDEQSSLCMGVDVQEDSTKTCFALSSCQLFSKVIGKYSLGCCLGRLLFSRSKDVTVSLDVARGTCRNIKKLHRTDPRRITDEMREDLEHRDVRSKEEDPVPEKLIQKKVVDDENLQDLGTSSDETNLKLLVQTPEPSSSNVELRKSTTSHPVEHDKTDVSSSRTVQPSHSLDNLRKNEIAEDKTPALEDVSLVTSLPLNSTQVASVSQMAQVSGLPKFTESKVDSVEVNHVADGQQSIHEQPSQSSLSSSQAIVLDEERVVTSRESTQQSSDPAMKNITSESGEEKTGDTSHPEQREDIVEHKSSVSHQENAAPNSIHVMSQASPDIDVLETKLTDKDGREGTAQLPEKLRGKVEEATREVQEIPSSRVVTDSSNVHADLANTATKEVVSSVGENKEINIEMEVSSTATVESQSVDSTIQPTLPPIADMPDLSESAVPIPAPPIVSAPPVIADASPSNLQAATVSSDSNLDATMLSKAQQAASTSAGTGSMAGSGLHKESIFVRLSNKIKALEQNLNMSTLYMEQLNQRYRKSLDELQKNADKKVALLTNATKKAESVINSQKEQISQMQSQLDNLTFLVADMQSRVGQLNKEVVERHVIGLCIEIILILVLFVVFARRRNTQERLDTLQRPGHFMNGHGPPKMAIEDSKHYKDNKIDPASVLSGKQQLLRSFGNTLTAETIGASSITDDLENKAHKADSFSTNDSKKKRNRKSKSSNTTKPLPDSSWVDASIQPEPSPDSNVNDDRTPSPASFLSRTAGLLFFGARGFFGGFQNPWKQKKPCTVHSDPNIAAMSDMAEVNKVPVKLKNPRITRARSLDLIPEEPDLHKYVSPPTPPLPSEIGVMFKRPPDCYYSKKGSVKNVASGAFKFGKYGVLDAQLA